jgi:DNA polymerase-4
MAALAEFDAVVEVAGWDEAFLAADTEDPEALARRIQDRIRAVTSLECTVGIGENKLQAKLAAGFGKPAGIFRLTHQSWYAVLGDRPTDALWGVGPKTARRLAALGIHTVADLAGTDPRDLAAHLGPVTGPWLVQTAPGSAPRRWWPRPTCHAPTARRSPSRPTSPTGSRCGAR